jgi:hypothetical protein
MASANLQRVLANLNDGGTVTQKILSWIAFFLLIVIIAYVLYFIFSGILKGYSRSFFDLIQLNFSNKVDVRKEFSHKNGTLYNALWYLANNTDDDVKFIKDKKLLTEGVFNVVGNCNGDNCENVFKNFLDVIEQYYEPEFRNEKTQQALTDYMAYHDKLSNDLMLKGLAAEGRIYKIDYILDGIINYMDKYAEIITKENEIVCARNDQKGFAKREEYNKYVEAKKEGLKQYLAGYGMKAISTDKQFANYFTDPWFVANCGRSFTKIYTALLEKTQHAKHIDEVKNCISKISEAKDNLQKATTQNKRDENLQIIKEQKQQKLDLEIKMARLRKMVTEQAIALKNKESKDNAILIRSAQTERKSPKQWFKKTGKSIESKFNKKNANKASQSTPIPAIKQIADEELQFTSDAEYTTMIKFEENPSKNKPVQNIYPLTTPRSDGLYNKIYVPCYEAYLHFVNLNARSPIFKSFAEKGMGKDEIIAYLFMKDLSMLQNEINDTTPPFIIRILKMYHALENITLCIRSTIDSSIGTLLQNIYLDQGNSFPMIKQDINKYKDNLQNAYKQDKFDGINSQTKITWNLMELLFMADTSVGNQFDIIFTRFHALAKITNNVDMIKLAQRINTYMNVSIDMNSINATSRIISALSINSQIKDFIVHYPIFSTLYFSSTASASSAKQEDIDEAKNTAKYIYDKTCSIIQVMPRMDIMTDAFDTQFEEFMKRVNSLKMFVLNAHMVYMYMLQYRHVIVEKDNSNGTRYERNGYVELYNEQYIGDKEFYNRLITPFKKDFIDNRVVSAWKRTFHKTFFDKQSKQSYWIDFNAFWIDTLRPQADKMIKNVWTDVGKSARLRW